MRPRTCDCGECKRCKTRERQARSWARKTPEQRREVIARRDRDRQRERDRERQRHPARAAQNKASAKRWADNHPEARRAHSRVAWALRSGQLERGPCEQEATGECSGLVHAHHDDYSKPLDVRWLCSVHHAKEHRDQWRSSTTDEPLAPAA